MRNLLFASLLVGGLLAVATPAHAMGVYIVLDVVAWNADGTAALVTRSDSSSAEAGASYDYLIVTTTDKTPASFTFTNTRDPDKTTEHVTAATCGKTATAFTAALAKHKFKGVTAKTNQCKVARREVVVIDKDANKVAKDAAAAGAAGSSRAVASDAAIKAENSNGDGTAVTANGQLVIVLSGANGDGSAPAHAAVYAAGTRVIEDLR